MADIFLSYKSERRPHAERLAALLEAYGYSVWWDVGLAVGSDFAAQIEREIDKAYLVIVLWDQLAVKSEWVKAEAKRARDQGKYVPVVLEPTELPLFFQDYQTLDLSDWNGEIDNENVHQLLHHIKQRSGREPIIIQNMLRLLDKLGPIDPEESLDSNSRVDERGFPTTQAFEKAEKRKKEAGRSVPRVFICYRRMDAAYQADLLYEKLSRYYQEPEKYIFMDIERVPLGVDLDEYLASYLSECDTLLALMSYLWMCEDQATGAPRIQNEDDYVRAEIRVALERQIPLIPIVFDDAKRPKSHELPKDIRKLSKMTGMTIRRETFEEQVGFLAGELGLK